MRIKKARSRQRLSRFAGAYSVKADYSTTANNGNGFRTNPYLKGKDKMMAKHGILHDYDLMANAEPSAKKHNKCVICDTEPVSYQWSDYSGEAMCRVCGAPYQLKWGSEEQKKEGNYPYLNLKTKIIPVIREYYQQAKCFTYLGSGIGHRTGITQFNEWIIKEHPELLYNKD
jgi:hypothetical protein